MTTRRKRRPDRYLATSIALGLTAAAASAAFAAVARASAKRSMRDADEALLEQAHTPPGHPLRRAAEHLGFVGKWWTYVPAAVGLAARVAGYQRPRSARGRRRRHRGASAIVASGLASFALNRAFDKWLPQPPAPPGHARRNKPVFPSGHAFGPSSVGLTTAYVLAREGLVSPAVTLPAAIAIPLVSAGTRVIAEKHWGSDILGGLVGGIAVAGTCLAAYELSRRTSML